MKSQKAKFFCENCGAEVPQNAKMCRHCGRFFSSVRCPACGATGKNEDFINGCPVCGYAVKKGGNNPSAGLSGGKNGNISFKEKNAGRKSRARLRREIEERNPKTFSRQKSDGTLPMWSFFVILAVLAGIIAGAAKYLEVF